MGAALSRAWPGSDDGLAPIGGLSKAYVGEPKLGKLPEDPLGGSSALLRRKLTGIGHRPNSNELPELVAGLRHLAGRGPDGARARCGSDRLRPRRSKQGFLHFAGDLWREHGDVFEAHIGPRRLVFVMHPDAVEQVTVSGRQRYDKKGSYDGARRYLIGQGLVGSTGDLWRRQRKLMAPFFTPRGVATYADLVIRDSLRFAVRWEDLADERREVDLSEEMMLITASIILKAMFSSETPESITQMKRAVETMIAYVDTQSFPVRVPTWVPSRRNHRYFEARHLVHGSIAALIAERRAIHETDWPNDLLSRLMEARDPDTGEAMTETLLRDESITMFFAGHETTARTMAAAWYALGTHPEVAARLHEELDSVLGDHAPTLEELHHLPYTLQVVKEVLRLYPAAPFYARDAIEDDQIGGFDVPSGATIMLSPFYTHRHPDFWTDPTASTPIGGHAMPRPPVTGTPTIPSQPARGSASATTSRCSRATCCSRSSRDVSARACAMGSYRTSSCAAR